MCVEPRCFCFKKWVPGPGEGGAWWRPTRRLLLTAAGGMHPTGMHSCYKIFTACKQSLGQGNIFSSMCQEFFSRGGVPGQVPPLGRYIPRAGTPPARYTPSQVHPLPGTPPWAGTPQAGTPPREQCMLGDTGNKRAVRIILECILVYNILVLNDFFVIQNVNSNLNSRLTATLSLTFEMIFEDPNKFEL